MTHTFKGFYKLLLGGVLSAALLAGCGGGGGGGGSTSDDNNTGGSTYSISGNVADSSNAAISGVTVALTGTSSGSTTTDSSGNYTFSGLADGSYTVTPSMTDYTFDPSSTAVTVSGANVTGQNFVGSTTSDSTPWSVSTIDSTGDVGDGISLIMDSNKKLHISYIDLSNNAVKYATNSSGSWIISTLHTDSTKGPYSTYITVDSNDKVHSTYNFYDYDELGNWITAYCNYVTNSSGAWVHSTVVEPGSCGPLAVDSNNVIHLIYADSQSFVGDYSPAKYATNASGSWIDSSTLENATNPSIVLDTNKNVHMSYFYYPDSNNSSDSQIKYATNASGSWVASVISNRDIGGDEFNSIAIDADNKVHICYYGSDVDYQLNYATNTSGVWELFIIENNGGDGWSCDIAIDSNGKAHISYGASEGLKYATNTGGLWNTTVVDGGIHISEETSIELDSDNKIHISYYDSTNDDLKYATNAP
ncbi:MAG: carboxypeptidase-like regulatory domain-containing protein [Deltaproteobacteria bacterium]|nr:carboxypeptidase-like regulatory domain-containing protein [Deltaproteobacteria bacterium]